MNRTMTNAAAPATDSPAATDLDDGGRRSATNRPGASTGRDDVDADLARAVRRAAHVRRAFYLIVIIVALAGQTSGAVQTLRIPLLWAVPAVAALELGGVVILSNADVRRRLGERATGSQILSALIAAGAVVFNWMSHPQPLHGGFFAGMSALGYLVWLTDASNARRDRLRAHGALPPTTPAYELVGHWLRHPRRTHRARSLAKANPHLGLFASITAASIQLDAERRRNAIAKVLHRKIRASVDPATADIAVAVYDLGEIAKRLASRADYEALTSLISRDLTAAQLVGSSCGPDRPPASPASPLSVGELRQQRHRRLFPADAAGPPAITTPAQPTHRSLPQPDDLTGERGTAVAATAAPGNAADVGAETSTSLSTADDAPAPRAVGPNADETSKGARQRQQSNLSVSGRADLVRTEPTPTGAEEEDQPAELDEIPRETAGAVAYWRRREPGISLRDVAARIGRSTRTVYRHWDATV